MHDRYSYLLKYTYLFIIFSTTANKLEMNYWRVLWFKNIWWDILFHNRFVQCNNSVRLIEAKSIVRLQSRLVLTGWVSLKLYMPVDNYKNYFQKPEGNNLQNKIYKPVLSLNCLLLTPKVMCFCSHLSPLYYWVYILTAPVPFSASAFNFLHIFYYCLYVMFPCKQIQPHLFSQRQ